MPYKCTLSKAALIFVEIEPKEMLRCCSKYIYHSIIYIVLKNGSYINNC